MKPLKTGVGAVSAVHQEMHEELHEQLHRQLNQQLHHRLSQRLCQRLSQRRKKTTLRRAAPDADTVSAAGVPAVGQPSGRQITS